MGVIKHAEKEKPQKLKTGADEAEGTHEARPAEAGTPEGGPRDAHEHARLAEAWQPESHASKTEEKQARDEVHEEEKSEGAAPGDPKNPRGFLKQIRPALKAPSSPLQQKQKKDGFEGQPSPARSAPHPGQAGMARPLAPHTPLKAATAVHAAVQVQAPPQAAPPPRPSRPPDAFSVLHAAQDPGVYFKEEGHNGPAETGNPELTAAIEEAIRLLFGVRGILRVSGGFNQAAEPAIIIVVTQGFGEASMKLVPPKVHKFETILAVPYDMLPLKRERL